MDSNPTAPPLSRFAAAALTFLAFAACQKSAEAPATAPVAKPAAVELVPANQRSKNFEAVSRQLELGGTLYGYMDIDGDVNKLAVMLKQMIGSVAGSIAVVPDVPPQLAAGLDHALKLDLTKAFTTLGLADIKALGLSSAPLGDGEFSNRVFVYTPEGRHGLMAAMGGAPAEFTGARLAPADTAFYSESDMDVPAAYAAIKDVVGQIAGPDVVKQMEAAMQQGEEEAGVTPLAVINSLKGRVVMLARFDPKNPVTLPLPTPVKIPGYSLLIRIDGLGAALEPVLAKAVPPDTFTTTTAGAMKIYALKIPLPVEGLRPALGFEGGALYLATTQEFLIECHDRKAGLDQDPDFKAALAAVDGEKGNGLGYASPRLIEALRQLAELNPQAPPQLRQSFEQIANQLPALKHPVVSVSINLPDGIVTRMRADRSLKQQVLMVPALAVVVPAGLMAAMAIPAFQKVRATSQEKVITNNLRMLNVAAQMYYIDHGVDTVTLDKLVGPEPGKHIQLLTPVAGEDYTKIQFRQGQPLSVTLPDGRTIKFEP